ncbi:MAG: TonB-dependent receptor [Cellvibrio sp.]|uniref:TonB-dependent receptor n=1 Tax=Cellvibrio sp. TaxID=1965322 RepID=UPI00271F33E5|nr:TonB-dependent receptor [Cellvibrio sp.]
MRKLNCLTAIIVTSVGIASLGVATVVQAHEAVLKKAKRAKNTEVEEVKVWGEARDSASSGYTNPTSVLTQEDMVSINATTTEDLVKYEPSIVIRKRYIGDSNGTLGLRGSNMFATPRSMVFADGVPLHYFLQTRWSGAPRWTMVSASEIAQVEILYGPFSAEYSGNSMGGVILIETAIPQERQVHVDLDYFAQDFSAYGFSDRLDGYKTFVAYGETFGDFSLYLSYNHLENESQPQSYYFDSQRTLNNAVPVTGLITDSDVYGKPAYYFGDTGIEQAVTDNFKIKLGYDFGEWSSLLNIAYEDRNTLRDTPNTYLTNSAGTKVWSGNFIQDDIAITVPTSRLGASELDRRSLSTGLRIKGELSARARFEANMSDFRILEDNNRASSHALQDPLFKSRGLTTNYEDTGWQTLEGKFTFSDVGLSSLELITGARYEAYELNLDTYNSAAWNKGDFAGYTGRSGGKTNISAAFVQANWDINERWDLALGGRYERWQSEGGYFSKDVAVTPEYDLVDVADASSNQFSPKFSLGYVPANTWLVRYSLAKAYRFPIVEELFAQSQSYSSAVEARPDLKPENGLHHNLMLEKQFDAGYARINIFTETIKDAIESQTTILPSGSPVPSVTTFSAVDEVETDGVEFILNRYGVLVPQLDIRFNIAYTKSIITDNSTAEGPNPATTLEGNEYPRMPRWRGNLMATYHASDRWDLSANLQYADKSFGRLQNDDTAKNVMGAQDGYTRVGVKTTYDVSEQIELGFGIDNLTDEESYVAHPWPGRSMYLSLSYDM